MVKSLDSAAQMKSVERDGSGALHLAKKNRMRSSFSKQELVGVGEWESRGDRSICCYSPQALEENKSHYTYVDRTFPPHSRGQVPPRTTIKIRCKLRCLSHPQQCTTVKQSMAAHVSTVVTYPMSLRGGRGYKPK